MSSCRPMGVDVHGDSHIYLISISPMQASSCCLPSYFMESQCNGGCPGYIGCCYKWCTKHQLNYLCILLTPTSSFFHLLLFLFFSTMFYSVLSFFSPYSLLFSLSPSPYYSLVCLSHVSTLSLFLLLCYLPSSLPSFDLHPPHPPLLFFSSALYSLPSTSMLFLSLLLYYPPISLPFPLSTLLGTNFAIISF
ncbi:hypothetical protein AMTRI_Chr10g4240 [Amborella trichopoda]